MLLLSRKYKKYDEKKQNHKSGLGSQQFKLGA